MNGCLFLFSLLCTLFLWWKSLDPFIYIRCLFILHCCWWSSGDNSHNRQILCHAFSGLSTNKWGTGRIFPSQFCVLWIIRLAETGAFCCCDVNNMCPAVVLICFGRIVTAYFKASVSMVTFFSCRMKKSEACFDLKCKNNHTQNCHIMLGQETTLSQDNINIMTNNTKNDL